MFMNNINNLIKGMLEDKQLRIIWFAVLIFGIASTILAWQWLPLTLFEAILDPIAVGFMIVKTIEYYRHK